MLVCLEGRGQTKRRLRTKPEFGDKMQARIWDVLGDNPMPVDQLVQTMALEAGQLMPTLTTMELSG